MVVNEQLKKQIIIEVLALLFLVGVIFYAVFAIRKSNDNKITSIQGMVIVVDDLDMKSLSKKSDGEGLEAPGIKYTVTNNNSDEVKYDLVVTPSIHDEDVLNKIRISVDDLYVSTLAELPRNGGGYVLTNYSLKAGYTKVHLIKVWYMLSTPEDLFKENIKFEYQLIKK